MSRARDGKVGALFFLILSCLNLALAATNCVPVMTTNGKQLTWMRCALSQAPMPRCISGEPFAYFLRPSPSFQSDKWMIFFEGLQFGGIFNEVCVSPLDCARNLANLSPLNSSYYGDRLAHLNSNGGGILSTNATISSIFTDFNVIYLPNCDGSFFTGNNSPKFVQELNVTVYFTGYANLLGALTDAIQNRGLKKAKEIIVSGVGNGGVSAQLHVDKIAEMTSWAQVRGLVSEGYWIDYPDYEGAMSYEEVIRNMLRTHNGTYNLGKNCRLNFTGSEWKCFFAQYYYPLLTFDFFYAQSLYDTSQIVRMLAPYDTGYTYWGKCLGDILNKCTAVQLQILNDFYAAITSSLQTGSYSNHVKNFWATGCVRSQLLTDTNYWNYHTSNGAILKDAVAAWYLRSTPTIQDLDPAIPNGCDGFWQV